MSYVRIWLHCVWGIKRNQKLISKSLHQKLINHIREKADEKGYILTASMLIRIMSIA